MGRKRKAILQQAEEVVTNELTKPEVAEAIKDAFDELLICGLASIEHMEEPGKSSAAENLRRYYEAQRKAK